MPRTAPAVTPGTNPASATTEIEDDLSGPAPTAALGSAAAPAGLDPAVAELIAAQAKQLAELTAMVQQMGRNQASATAAPVKLPTMAAVLKQKPDVAVLTEEGWFVPAVHPTDRLTKA